MTLPTAKDKELYYERPGDEIFATIKHHFPHLRERGETLKKELVAIILEDMALDHALSSALDEVGKVLEYQAQNEGIERPRFNGLAVLKDAERVGKLQLVLRLCKALEFGDDTTEAVRTAEIDRLWSAGLDHAPKDKKDHGPVLKLPDEVAGLLRDITKGLNKKVGTDDRGKPSNSTHRFAREPGPSNKNSKTPGGVKK